MHGRVNLGAGIESGKNMNMMIGGKIPFNPNDQEESCCHLYQRI